MIKILFLLHFLKSLRGEIIWIDSCRADACKDALESCSNFCFGRVCLSKIDSEYPMASAYIKGIDCAWRVDHHEMQL